MSERRTHSIWQDEQGDWSAARIMLAASLGFSFAFLAAVTIWQREVSDSEWHLLEAVNIALAGWAGAPRVARYFSKPRPPAEENP